jgi:hypothetical protein
MLSASLAAAEKGTEKWTLFAADLVHLLSFELAWNTIVVNSPCIAGKN